MEGNDVILPMIDFIIEESTKLGADEIIIGMAHRGRLNVLVNIFQKDLKNMLAEFSGNLDAEVGDGDVKYHMGFSKDATSWSGKPVHLSLMPNPSHLEAVNPVLMGVTRAKQKLKGENGRNRTLAILLHGDASFCGQGIIYETLNMSELRGYSVGGIIHIIVNNQVGFTTSPVDSRSTPQVTDISKMLEIPIFHVNADEPEAALRCAALGLHYRYKFYRDVVIDVVGYRRYGHNESDEPTFTQPVMYKNINSHPRVREIYAQKLAQGRIVEEAQSQELMNQYEQRMEAALDEAKKGKVSPMMQSFGERWKTLAKPDEKGIFSKIETAVSVDVLKKVGQTILTVPTNFNLHPKIKKLVEDRQEMIDEKRPLDWGLGEALAFGSLVQEGLSVRLAGQDAERGTFSHRQSVWHDVVSGEKYSTINAVKNEKADFKVINSLLSEYAALGFEFGQSLANPNKLVIWEAQFGDFANGAQIIIDQFITCSSYKWQRYSGLVMLLPHGYEGQGPEHSSARLERFLQLCAQNNIQVCNLTTPAQIFHALRRQLHRAFRLPLIVMSPKSLLRHPSAVSPLVDFTHGSFKELIDDDDPETIASNRVIFCSGKIYYDLVEARKQANKKVPIVRVEQLYPFAQAEWKRILARYAKAEEIIWCQEAPQNMESWNFIAQYLPPLISGNKKITYVGRAAQASPADSYMHLHQKEQKRIVATALGI